MTRRWYAEGLRFSCTRCGHCCRRPGWIVVRPAEAERIARRLGEAAALRLADVLWTWDDSEEAWVIDVPPQGACPLLGPTGCTVHDIKPIQCATYPFWPEILASAESWAEEARECEGMGVGERVYSERSLRTILLERARTLETLVVPEASAEGSDEP